MDTAEREDLAALRTRADAVTAGMEAERRHPGIPKRDLAPFAAGNAGCPFVFRYDSGRPGPSALVTCLAHGNEPGGLEAVLSLIERGVRPVAGRLTLAICNLAAREAGNGVDPYGCRFVDDDFNRVWDAAILDGPRRSAEIDRARELRPFLDEADLLLDLHATPYEATPFLVLRPGTRAIELSGRLSQPRTRFHFETGSPHATMMTNYRQFGDPGANAVGIAVECGLFFAAESADVARAAIGEVLGLHGVLSPADAEALMAWRDPAPARAITVVEAQPTHTGRVTFLSRVGDLTAFAEGEVAAFDGDEPIRAPFEGAILLWVKQTFVAGDTAFMWAREAA